jgi:hypothetical protein
LPSQPWILVTDSDERNEGAEREIAREMNQMKNGTTLGGA